MVKLQTLQSFIKIPAMRSIRIATRNSPLALWQANFVKDQLIEAHPELHVEIVGMTTKGDILLDRSLAAVGGKGLFLKELEVSLQNKTTDIAVHSMKDVPVDMPEGLEIAVVCERADPRDAFVSNEFQNLYALPKGARVGTASLRRASQLKSAFPTLEFVELRGNVNTRLSKLDKGEYDAIILAAAGLIRLGFVHRIKQFITPELCLPAVGQGIVGIECRSEDEPTKNLLQALHNRESDLVLIAERAMNRKLQGGCQVPIAGFAELTRGKLRMRGMVAATDGSKVLFCNMLSSDVTSAGAEKLGREVAAELLNQGAKKLLSEMYQQAEVEPLKAYGSKASKPIILLTRQERYLGNMVSILERLDYQPLHLPTLEVEQFADDKSLAKIQALASYTDVLFVSRNAVEFGMVLIDQHSEMPKNMRALTVGAESAKQLYKFGVDAMFPEHGSGADALLAVSQLADLSNRRILIFRGEHGLDWPADEMRKRGAEVDNAVVYKQKIPQGSAQHLEQLLENHQTINGVFAHSAQSITNLFEIAGDNVDRLCNSVLVAGSQRIADTARELGWSGDIRVAESPSNKHMMITFSG